MKSSGFTLIETIASVYILVIILCIGICLSKFENKISSNMENLECIYEIQNLISYGKAVCRDKDEYGKVTTSSEKKEVRFIEGWDSIEKIIKLPKNLELISKDINIYISPGGKVETSNTIYLYDDNCGKTYKITIAVGVDRFGNYNDGDSE